MYLTSIHNIVDKYLENKKKLSSQPVGGAGGDSGDEYRNQWNQEETARLFDKIRTLLMKVDNCEMAVTGATWVVKKLPMGQFVDLKLSNLLSTQCTEIWNDFILFVDITL